MVYKIFKLLYNIPVYILSRIVVRLFLHDIKYLCTTTAATDQLSPMLLRSLNSLNSKVKYIACGDEHTVVLTEVSE